MRRPVDHYQTQKKKKKRWHSFFKIIHLSIIQDKRLELPKKFALELPDVAIVMVPCGTIWRVQLRKAKGQIWFENGWQEFMDYYSIDVGHFLIFRYDGNSRFHVNIFDMSACKIEYPCHTNDLEEHGHETVCRTPSTEESDTDVEILDVRLRCLNNARKKVFDECEIQQTTSITCLNPMTRIPISRQLIAAKVIDLGSYDKHKQKARVLAKQDELDPVEPNRCEKFAFDFKVGPEVITIDPDSESDDDPTMTTPHKSSSSKKRDNSNLAKKIDTRTSFSPSSGSVGVHLNKGKRKRPKTDEAVETHRVNRRTKPGCHDLSKQEANSDVGVTRKRYSTPADVAAVKERAIKAAREFRPKNPFCVIIIRPSYLSYHVRIPMGFAMAYLSKNIGSVTLRVSNRRTWHVRCSFKKSYTRLDIGWEEFVTDNQLKEYDVCVFELVDRHNLELYVTIFRFS